MSDEQIENFMASVETNEELEDHDDSVKDPDYVLDDSDYVFDELQPEDNAMISDCLELLDTTTMMNAVSLSMDVSNVTFIEKQQCQQLQTMK